MEENNQVIQDGFQEISNSIENLRGTIENNSNNGGFSILIIILIVVLISINNNIKKLIKAITDKDKS